MLLLIGVVLLLSYASCNCDSEIYCRGPILQTIQNSGLFKDSKKYVDMPTSQSKAAVLKSFAMLQNNYTEASLKSFINENFHRPGYEMKIVIPKDWAESPSFLENLKDSKMLQFAKTIHSKWKSLTRKFDRRKICKECQASSFELPYPFIVPGGRFREFYYWDSYWILEGLYVSEMCTTASGMIENMLVMIEEFGFIPNGARIYYMNRSQPPMFAMIIDRFIQECIKTDEERRDYIQRTLPIVEKEYGFWMKERTAEILWNGKNHTLNVYRAEHWMPRPESFSEDSSVASDKRFDTDLKKQILFQNIASAAESGWDFTERWLKHGSEFETIRTVMLVPTDLNSIMHRNEMIMSTFSGMLGNNEKKQLFQKRAEERLSSINDLLYSNGSWIDFDLESMGPARNSSFISDIAPLFFIDSIDNEKREHALKNFEELLFGYPGGIPANKHISGQQWDFPNAWAPIQQLSIALFLRLDNLQHGENYFKALNIAQRWINSTFCGYEIFSQVFEKYHAEMVGHPGGGGEYIVQEGFGWTNGVILWILKTFGNDLSPPTQCVSVTAASYSKPNRILTVVGNLMMTIALLFKFH